MLMLSLYIHWRNWPHPLTAGTFWVMVFHAIAFVSSCLFGIYWDNTMCLRIYLIQLKAKSEKVNELWKRYRVLPPKILDLHYFSLYFLKTMGIN